VFQEINLSCKCWYHWTNINWIFHTYHYFGWQHLVRIGCITLIHRGHVGVLIGPNERLRAGVRCHLVLEGSHLVAKMVCEPVLHLLVFFELNLMVALIYLRRV